MAIGDPGELVRLAQRVRVEADEVRGLASRVAATTAVPWRSTAAGVFRDRVHERVAHLRSVATRVDEAADLLGVHAGAVASVVQSAEDVVRHAGEAARDVLRAEAVWPRRGPHG